MREVTYHCCIVSNVLMAKISLVRMARSSSTSCLAIADQCSRFFACPHRSIPEAFFPLPPFAAGPRVFSYRLIFSSNSLSGPRLWSAMARTRSSRAKSAALLGRRSKA